MTYLFDSLLALGLVFALQGAIVALVTPLLTKRGGQDK